MSGSKAILFGNKTFVSGRCARAGRRGQAFSLVSPNELCYLLDLHLFLNRPLTVVQKGVEIDATKDGYFGRIPGTLIDEELADLAVWSKNTSEVVSTRVTRIAFIAFQ